jgi:hypothetical protein
VRWRAVVRRRVGALWRIGVRRFAIHEAHSPGF